MANLSQTPSRRPASDLTTSFKCTWIGRHCGETSAAAAGSDFGSSRGLPLMYFKLTTAQHGPESHATLIIRAKRLVGT